MGEMIHNDARRMLELLEQIGQLEQAIEPLTQSSEMAQRIGRPLHNDTLLVELRPILHIHLHPQTSKNLHLCFHLGRADHPQRVK